MTSDAVDEVAAPGRSRPLGSPLEVLLVFAAFETMLIWWGPLHRRPHQGARRSGQQVDQRQDVELADRRLLLQVQQHSRAYTRLHRWPPAETDMQQYFRVSPPSVHQMVLTFERSGFIRRQPGVARGIEMLVDPEHLPVLR